MRDLICYQLPVLFDPPAGACLPLAPLMVFLSHCCILCVVCPLEPALGVSGWPQLHLRSSLLAFLACAVVEVLY